VNEQLWKFPEGGIAPRFKPVDSWKFFSCLPNGNLCLLEESIAGTVVVEVDGTERDVSGLSMPLMKEVRLMTFV